MTVRNTEKNKKKSGDRQNFILNIKIYIETFRE